MREIEIVMTQDYRDQQGRTWAGEPRDVEIILSIDEDLDVDVVKAAVDELVFNGLVVFDGDATAHSGDVWTKSEYHQGDEYRLRAILKGFTAKQLKAIHERIAQHEQADARNWVPAGIAEGAIILGVSEARMYQWRADHPLFPAPVRTLAMGEVYDEADLRAFDKVRNRGKGGRPRKAPEVLSEPDCCGMTPNGSHTLTCPVALASECDDCGSGPGVECFPYCYATLGVEDDMLIREPAPDVQCVPTS